MKKFFLLILFFFLSVNFVFAQKEGDLSASPGVINDSGTPREILEYSIKLSNNTDHKLNIFPLVLDIEKGRLENIEGLLERQYLMTEWMSIKRGAIEIMPNSEISLPLTIDIVHNAIPGDYFASITFAHGAHRGEAEENAIEMSPPKLLINLVVEDQSVEKLSVFKYFPDKKLFTNPKPKINLELNNPGTVDLIPRGNIFIYNKRNQEVDAIDVNPDSKKVLAGKASLFEITTNNNLGTGKYKARLEIEYGNKISRDINDTVYLIVITLPFLILFGAGLLIFIVLLSKLIFRKTYHHHLPKNSHNQSKKVSIKRGGSN